MLLTEIANGIIRACRDGATNLIKNVTAGVDPTDAVNVSQLTASRPYKSYVALLTQAAADAPTAVIMENTLGTVSYQYFGTGNYRVVSAGLFTYQKTAIFIAQDRGQANGVFYAFWVDASTIAIQTIADPTNGSSLQDVALLNDAIEIRVYN